jgi:hypothetical protein
MSRLIVFSMLTLAAWAQSPPTVTRVYQGGNNPTPLSPNTVAYLVGAAFGTQPTISVNGENATLIGSKDALAAFFIPADLPTGPAAVVVTTFWFRPRLPYLPVARPATRTLLSIAMARVNPYPRLSRATFWRLAYMVLGRRFHLRCRS